MSIYDQIEEARLAHIQRQYRDHHREHQRHLARPRKGVARLLARAALLVALAGLGLYAVSEFYEGGAPSLQLGSSGATSPGRSEGERESAAIDSVVSDPGRYIETQ